MNELSTHEWRSRAATLAPRRQAFIDGRYVNAAAGRTFACINPANGQHLAEVAACDAEDVTRAVNAARRSFEAGHWSRESPAARKRVLLKLAALIEAHSEELALTETLDVGKPIRDSLNVDVPGVARCIAWYAEAADKVYGEIAPTRADALALVTREPVGVVGAIVPWNFPLLMAAWKLGPALAAGNSVVLKPSEKSPLTALRLAELAAEAGLPEGVLNVVPGTGEDAGRPLALHMDVDCLAFTGSTRTGRHILRYAGESNLKRVSLECGGKTPNIVCADCADLDVAAAAAAEAIFYNQGEMCSAGSRLLVERPIADAFIARVLAEARHWQAGDPLNPATRMGAIVDGVQLDKVMNYIAQGVEEGARLRTGGTRTRAETGGHYVAPTIFDRVRNDMRIAREEIFGPVLSVIEVAGFDEAIRIANDSHYGLAAAIWTRDIDRAHRAARALRAGTVWVNCFDADDLTVPFGGFRESGFGRDKSLHALDKYSELKTTWIRIQGL